MPIWPCSSPNWQQLRPACGFAISRGQLVNLVEEKLELIKRKISMLPPRWLIFY